MKNKLILHIGMPKTGTSAIQGFLYKNRDLLKKNGILYPEIKNTEFPIANALILNEYMKDTAPNISHPGWIQFWNAVCQRRTVKNLKRRPENDPNAGNIASVIYAGTPSAGQLSAGSSAGGTGWTPAFNRSRSR